MDGEQRVVRTDMRMRVLIVDKTRKEVHIYDFSEPPSTPPPHRREPIKRLAYSHSNEFILIHVTQANELAFVYRAGEAIRFLKLE